jgi:hypothetical protein
MNALDPYENGYEINWEEIVAGERMFESFLDYCVEMGIIEEYDRTNISKVFAEHNTAVRENGERESVIDAQI